MKRPLLLSAAVLLSSVLCFAPPVLASFPERVFAPYVDVLLYPEFSLRETFERTGQRYFTLAFVVSGGECTPAWGGVVPLGQDHYREEIEAVRSEGGDVILSFGGAAGVELAGSCTDASRLQAAYQAVIDRYQLRWVDFDIEGAAVADRVSIDRRNRAIQGLQAANPGLKVAFCLPVLPSGLTPDGLHVLENAVQNGVRIDLVNVMAMDYGDGAAPDPEGRMGQYAIDAGNNTRSQLQARGIDAAIGVTPMIGQNDVGSERFYLSDAQRLASWAGSRDWVGLLSMWSCNRDNGGCPGQAYASPVCSGVAQTDYAFIETFQSFTGGGGNLPPEVSLSGPSEGEAFDPAETIVLRAEATDPDGHVVQVEFFVNGRSVGSDPDAPYEAVLGDFETGVHELFAEAEDDAGAVRRSATVRISVGGACVSPAWDPARVYWGGDEVSHAGREWRAAWWTRGEEPGTTGPWGVWKEQGACAGGGNAPPTVRLLSPSGPGPFVEGDDIPLLAEAEDPDGRVVQVEILLGALSLGVVSEPPYAVLWQDVPAGTYSLTAVATDDEGAAGTSEPVSVTVEAVGGGCSLPAWDRTRVYWGRDRAFHDGHAWEAKWWTLGEEPGTTGLWGVWKDLGSCADGS